MTDRYTEIRYKCRCMAAEASIHVVGRDSVEEILNFMARVQRAIGADHHKRSPACRSTTMEYAKVPIEGDRIGAAEGGRA